MAKRVAFTDLAKADIRAIPQPNAVQILVPWPAFWNPTNATSRSSKASIRRSTGFAPRTAASSSASCPPTRSKSPASMTARQLTAEGLRSQEDRALRPQTRQWRILGLQVGSQERIRSHPPRKLETRDPQPTQGLSQAPGLVRGNRRKAANQPSRCSTC